MDAVDTIDSHWKQAEFSKYDVVYNVASIAHLKAAKGESPLVLHHQVRYGDRDRQDCQGGWCEAVYTHEFNDCV